MGVLKIHQLVTDKLLAGRHLDNLVMETTFLPGHCTQVCINTLATDGFGFVKERHVAGDLDRVMTAQWPARVMP